LHNRLGTTAIYVTHDQVEAMTLGDRVVVMKDGIVQQVGEPLELYNTPANKFVAGFIGSPAMNFSNVRIIENGGALWAENAGMKIKVPDHLVAKVRPHTGQPAILGVRPEDIAVADGTEPDGTAFTALTEVVERLGSETLLDVRVADGTMVASVDPTSPAKIQENIRLVFNPKKIHFFEAQSERSISHA
jgi:multiple sugar transport system ATP-binding protein